MAKQLFKALAFRLGILIIVSFLYCMTIVPELIQPILYWSGFIALLGFGLSIFLSKFKKAKNGLSPVQKSEL